MSHPLLKTAMRLLGAFMLLFAFADVASACFCSAAPSVLAAYEDADAVLIVRVLSFEHVGATEPNGSTRPTNVRKSLVSVERVYKGDVKVNDQLTFGQSLLLRCAWIFDETAIGREFLVYAKISEKNTYETVTDENGVYGSRARLLGQKELDTVTVEGVLYCADGQPASKQTVRFEPVEERELISLTARDLLNLVLRLPIPGCKPN